ncbi:hypothetical protein ACS0TY_014769 [Phlomoides rotata]
MGSFSGLGIGLSFVFGCILMGLVAEVYYLLWWKKRIANSSSEIHEDLSSLFCWKKPTSFNSASSTQELTNCATNPQDEEMGSNKNSGVKDEFSEEGIEQELMRVHNLCGPPRFLFTIKEESREDLESDDGKSRKCSRARSLSDVVFAAADGTPFLTPISSPTPNNLDSYNHHGINPLFESITEAELNRLRSSPPPKFKFLKDAEDKLLRKMIREESGRRMGYLDEKSGGFVSVIDVREQLHNQASQVLPLSSSPTFQKL